MNRFIRYGIILGTITACTANPTDLMKIEAYCGTDLELCYTAKRSTFTVWAPTAEAVKLRIYETGEGGEPISEQLLRKDSLEQVWRGCLEGNWEGKFYTFAIRIQKQWLPETPGIWAKAVGINGNRAAIINPVATNPVGWESDRRPPMPDPTSIVVYEMHHRDMTMHASSGIQHKGKYKAWTETQSQTDKGFRTGLAHLKELGITHVHLLPSFDFESIDERKPDQNSYNWGYDPKNYNVPEGSYSTNPFDPANRIREFKEMVQNFHQAGIRVILDVVYNHTHTAAHSPFSLTVPHYFYRYWPDGKPGNASACGNETASEKAMMRRYMVESVKYWIQEYHIDGFRFDLMGIHDIATMNTIREAANLLDPTILIYGEGWNAGDSPLPIAQRAIKAHAKQIPGIAVFNDDLRDAVKGSYSNNRDKGFASGKRGMEMSVKFGIVGAIDHPQIDYNKVNYSKSAYTLSSLQAIQYVSCHDDLCLVDKLKASNPGASVETLKRMHKLAHTIVFTSQGIPFLFCGEEIFRDKKGIHNSFQSPDSINAIDWNLKETHQDLFLYYQKLIALRKNHPAFRMATAAEVNQHLTFLPVSSPLVVAFTLNAPQADDAWSQIVVVHNGNNSTICIDIPRDSYKVIVEDGQICEQGLAVFKGKTLCVKGISTTLLAKEREKISDITHKNLE